MSKKPVSITIQSIQSDDGLQESTTETHAGALYHKEGGRYLLYKTDEVSTTIHMDPQEIRLFRRGSMESWQIFRPGEYSNGVLSLGVNGLLLSVLTTHMRLDETERGGRLELHYQLFTGGSSDPGPDPLEVSMGQFQLSVDWAVADPD